MKQYIIPFVTLIWVSLPAYASAAPFVFLLDKSNSVDYTVEDIDGRMDMGGNHNFTTVVDRYPNRWDLMLLDLGAIIDGMLPTTENTFSVIPWNSKPYAAIPVWDTGQPTATYLANVVSERRLPQGPTNLGQALVPYHDSDACEFIAVVTEDHPDDEALVREALYSILLEQPVAIFVLEYSESTEVLDSYRDLVQHPDLTVAILNRKNVLVFVQKTEGQIRPCLSS